MANAEEDDGTLELEQSTQHLKDFKLAIEFKYLMKHAPGGVFLMPQLDDIRKLDGVIFLRRGLYRDGVFRFQMTLPYNYNGWNSHPRIVFTPPIFSPLIDPETGVLDLRAEESLKEWIPEKHFCVTALIFLKKIFYMKTFDHFTSVGNEEARQLFVNDKDAFLEKIRDAVQKSLLRVYDKQDSDCSICFSKPIPAHDIIRQSILGDSISAADEGKEFTVPAADQDCGNVTKRLDFYDASNEAEDAEDRERQLPQLHGTDIDAEL